MTCWGYRGRRGTTLFPGWRAAGGCTGRRTLITDAALERAIAATRRAGFARCVDEAAAGSHALGVAVRRPDGAFVAALSRSFPTHSVRQGRIRVSDRVERWLACAGRLGQIGYSKVFLTPQFGSRQHVAPCLTAAVKVPLAGHEVEWAKLDHAQPHPLTDGIVESYEKKGKVEGADTYIADNRRDNYGTARPAGGAGAALD